MLQCDAGERYCPPFIVWPHLSLRMHCSMVSQTSLHLSSVFVVLHNRGDSGVQGNIFALWGCGPCVLAEGFTCVHLYRKVTREPVSCISHFMAFTGENTERIGEHRSKLELRVLFWPNSAKLDSCPGYMTKQRLATLLAKLDQDLDLAGSRDVLGAVEVDNNGNITIGSMFITLYAGIITE